MSRKRSSLSPTTGKLLVPGAAYLLSQVGIHSSRLWSERLRPLGVDARQVLLLRHIAAEQGRSQQALGRALDVPASRIVALVDELEERGLVERRRDQNDRRVHALFLTRKGKGVLKKVSEISREHEKQLCAGLGADERDQLIDLLGKVAAQQGLAVGSHPGFGDSVGGTVPR
jgi:DNA-binding MarR family transcriptional regulator